MGATDVAKLPLPLPDYVTVQADNVDIRFTPNEMRRLKTQTGRTMTDLMGEGADEPDRLQAMVWLELTRQGHEPTWDQAGNVALRFEVEPPDPSNGDS